MEGKGNDAEQHRGVYTCQQKGAKKMDRRLMPTSMLSFIEYC